jgi:membrane-associated phospholipid phosphatase
MNTATYTRKQSLPLERKWKLKKLLLCHMIVALLIATFFWPLTKVFWEKLDVLFFQTINATLKGNPNWQLFWACANHKIADWVEDVCLVTFWVIYIRSKIPSQRARGVAELLFCVLYIAAIIFFVNQLVFRETLQIPRDSPTSMFDSAVKLSREINWMKIKDHSSTSFPGDHGTTALLFAASFTFFAGWRFGLVAWGYALFLCLPRLITGAHWLSDVILGSGSIALLFLGWAFYSPFSQRIIDGIEKGISWIKRKLYHEDKRQDSL